MSKLIVNGGSPLRGALRVQGAKNSVLPILASAYLTNGESVLHNCPELSDVQAACRILRMLGCHTEITGGTIRVLPDGAAGTFIPAADMCEMRSSIIFLGAILARTGTARLSAPGGCDLGPRPIDLHLYALRRMGAVIRETQGQLVCSAPDGLCGAVIHFPSVSVGATENALIAAVTARGCTRIRNAAREPEIVDLAAYLQKCGARIYGAGTPELYVEGVPRLRGAEHTVLPDRIGTATYLTAAAVTGGDVTLYHTEAQLLMPVLHSLHRAGCEIECGDRQIQLTAPCRLRAMGEIFTAPYPDFPTDAQALLMAAASVASGETRFTDTVFPHRFRHVAPLCAMGACITVKNDEATVRGVEHLHGASVQATDLRGGAALVIAGLAAHGTTTISRVCHIDRGYEHIETALAQLGADITRKAEHPGRDC
jgi:UDP-N-acetylglucosamine 1-carboxyvinyltransferase